MFLQRHQRALVCFLLLSILAATGLLADQELQRVPSTHALLINGGLSANQNYQSHLHHLQDMMDSLLARGIAAEQIHVFSADGSAPEKDLAVRRTRPELGWLLGGTGLGRSLNPRELSNTVWDGVTLHPARFNELRRWFSEMRDELDAGDTLIVFVTDHGTRNKDDPDNGLIALWDEKLSVLQFRALLAHLEPGVRVVNIMSQCYSGAFADAMAPFHSRVPDGRVCGFYSSPRDRLAYGCYPEGRDRDRIGHAFRFVDALDRNASLAEAHAEVLLTDMTPDVPLRTSDVFMEEVLGREATRRATDLDTMVDELLEQAWQDRARWEPQIRLLDRLGEAYGILSPRSLAEIGPQLEDFEALAADLKTYENRWMLTIDEMRRENLQRFRTANPEWAARLNADKIKSLSADDRRKLHVELLSALHAFSRDRGEAWERLQLLHETFEDAKTARYRVDVRLAALLRIRLVLLRLAGLQLLSGVEGPGAGMEQASTSRVDLRQGLAALTECEESVLGSFDGVRQPQPDVEEMVEILPPYESDLEIVRRVLPSWLGIGFRESSNQERQETGDERGAIVVQSIYPDSPASAAGLQPGDTILGPPGRRFLEPRQVREWTMTSPRNEPLKLEVRRNDGITESVTLALAPYPSKLPELPGPPVAGDPAPPLASLEMLDTSGAELDLSKSRHMLFFWATWCQPCKQAVPELMAWSQREGVPVLAVSDETRETVKQFLDGWEAPFPKWVATDRPRGSHVSYVVNGTPTFVLIGDDATIEWRQVGYAEKNHRLEIPGWSWNKGD